MRLREILSDLIGAEVQQHPVTMNGQTKTLNYRQISDAEGRKIFGPSPDGESAEDRSSRIMVQLVVASLCDEDGKAITDEDEVRSLPYGSLAALVQGAYVTNNLVAKPQPEDAAEDGGEGDVPAKKA